MIKPSQQNTSVICLNVKVFKGIDFTFAQVTRSSNSTLVGNLNTVFAHYGEGDRYLNKSVFKSSNA